jgi:diamine N-acetyltransferase
MGSARGRSAFYPDFHHSGACPPCRVTIWQDWLAIRAALPLSLTVMSEAEITIRKAIPGDGEALALIGAASFLESYAGVVDGAGIIRHCAHKHTASVYEAALADPLQGLWLAEMAPGGAPVGYLHLSPPDLPVPYAPGDIEIKRIYVLSRLHGAGLGRRLMETALSHAREAGRTSLILGVYKGNARALAFYGRMGFEALGERQFDVGGNVYCDWIMGRAV